MDLDSENESSKKGDSYEEQEQVLKEEKNEAADLVRNFLIYTSFGQVQLLFLNYSKIRIIRPSCDFFILSAYT